MAQVYADLIKKGLKTIDDVPAKLKDAVQAILDADVPDRIKEQVKQVLIDLDCGDLAE